MHAHDYEWHREALRRRVCSICLDSDDEGRCALAGSRSCAMQDQLVALVDTVRNVTRRGDNRYAAAVDEQVCTRCPDRDPGGRCQLRDQGRCAVAVYLPLIVEAFQQSR
jgi:hypothetical protein